ncbi:GspE/PulE family protein [Candidatus Nitronereus thalassa]|uniref:GspE/PulE family protein n=1 Tax=Candidatus Nitronereus thalassa TaxID=3020898 RepID=A0ABU3K3V7_9BACT|nr:GspE/PulE family protein [Candidatus Nitronereus thalassa]MDT7041072.1 GspE/PulE family protein [Candidatus Nitronereus thalassa]
MATPVKRTSLEEILLKHELLSPTQLSECMQRAESTATPLREILLEEGLVKEEPLARAIAEQFGLPFEPLHEFRVDPDFFSTIPVEWMHRQPFAPLSSQDGFLTIAVTDPQNLRAIDELELLLGQEVRLVVTTKTAIEDGLAASEGNKQALTRIQAELHPVLVKEDDKGEEILSVESISRDQSPVVKLVDTIILSALQKHASDIHIEPNENSIEVKFRIDGVLYPAMEPLAPSVHSSLISRLKIMSELDISERRIPQDGRFKLHVEKRTVDFRVSILPSVFAESIVIRVLDKSSITTGVGGLNLDVMGYPPEDLRRFRRAITRPYGMVLVTGPTGSGKTTTLYGALNEVHSPEDKIITIEDPVEYQLGGIVQIPVNEKKGLTFARGLRSILRHDPDKIMVGEIRDAETAQIAIQSALTGHLVFTTVHANNAFDVISRFVNMGIERFNFVSSLSCILAQRLVRAICPYCKVPVPADPDLCRDSGIDYERAKTYTFYEGKGCHECNGLGFKGRRAITEFLDVNESIKEMILTERTSSEIHNAAFAQGMTTLRQNAVQKVIRGETTLREINRVTPIEDIG